DLGEWGLYEVPAVRPRPHGRVLESWAPAPRQQVSNASSICRRRVLSASDFFLHTLQECPARYDHLAREDVRGLLLSLVSQRRIGATFREACEQTDEGRVCGRRWLK